MSPSQHRMACCALMHSVTYITFSQSGSHIRAAKRAPPPPPLTKSKWLFPVAILTKYLCSLQAPPNWTKSVNDSIQCFYFLHSSESITKKSTDYSQTLYALHEAEMRDKEMMGIIHELEGQLNVEKSVPDELNKRYLMSYKEGMFIEVELDLPLVWTIWHYLATSKDWLENCLPASVVDSLSNQTFRSKVLDGPTTWANCIELLKQIILLSIYLF